MELYCWICGKPATKSFGPGRKAEPARLHKRSYCDKCFDEERDRINRELEEYIKLRKDLMYERAVRLLESQEYGITRIKDLLKEMREFVIENPDKFDSSHEVVAAIVLVDNNYKVKAHYRILNYEVDFLIPELKCVLEIDGNLHDRKLYHDNKRDIEIRAELGSDWEIVRIGTNYIEQNAKMLPDAIIAVRDEKQKIRRSNYGVLPEWYSRRETAKKHKHVRSDDEVFDVM